MWIKSSGRLINLDEIALVEIRRSVGGDEEYALDAYHSGDNQSPRIEMLTVSGPGAREEVDAVYNLICDSVAGGQQLLDLSDRQTTPAE